MRIEQVLFWCAVAFYGLGAFSYIFGVITRAE